MKKTFHNIILVVAAGLCVAAVPSDNAVMTKTDDGTVVVNSTTLCTAKGFRGMTPVEVHIKKGVVTKIVPLKNNESPSYFATVKKNLLPLYDNVKVSQAKKISQNMEVDGCTGATYSTKAVQKNIESAIDYFNSHSHKKY